MKKTGLWLTIVVGLQVLWMFGTSASKELNLRGGTTVLLETMPVDPRDLLRGDYVILNYKISSIPIEWLYPGQPPTGLNNQTVYVTLEKRGEFNQPIAASLSEAKPQQGQIIIRGQLDDSRGVFRGGNIRVRYGIEKYFVHEGAGNPNGKLTVRCVVNRDQSLQIKDVYVNGKPYADAEREK